MKGESNASFLHPLIKFFFSFSIFCSDYLKCRCSGFIIHAYSKCLNHKYSCITFTKWCFKIALINGEKVKFWSAFYILGLMLSDVYFLQHFSFLKIVMIYEEFNSVLPPLNWTLPMNKYKSLTASLILRKSKRPLIRKLSVNYSFVASS